VNSSRYRSGSMLWITCVLGCAVAGWPGEAPESVQAASARPMWVYVGTYTGPKSEGIYLLELDPASGALTSKGLAGACVNPSFLAIHPSRKFLYAVDEIDNFDGKKAGGVSAFAIDSSTGMLTRLNQQSSGGAGPCYVVVDKAGKNALVANYGGGSVEVLPIQDDGKLGEASAFIQHAGTVALAKRQGGPHAHSINLDAANRFAVAADLGLDKLFVYKFDALKGTLTPNEPPFASVAAGSGPRHFAFHPDGRHAYVINEITLTVTAFEYEPERGAFKELQTISTVPDGPKPGLSTAEVQVHPSGKFLYGSNRGHDSIVIYAIDAASGKLTLVDHQPTQGKTPRNFGIDPTGTFLLAENQNSDSIVVFRIDPQTGRLEPTGKTVQVPSPVCAKFMPKGE
jgi:6-phosphogluconolactonase